MSRLHISTPPQPSQAPRPSRSREPLKTPGKGVRPSSPPTPSHKQLGLLELKKQLEATLLKREEEAQGTKKSKAHQNAEEVRLQIARQVSQEKAQAQLAHLHEQENLDFKTFSSKKFLEEARKTRQKKGEVYTKTTELLQKVDDHQALTLSWEGEALYPLVEHYQTHLRTNKTLLEAFKATLSLSTEASDLKELEDPLRKQEESTQQFKDALIQVMANHLVLEDLRGPSFYANKNIVMILQFITTDFYAMGVEISDLFARLGGYYNDVLDLLTTLESLSNYLNDMYNKILTKAEEYNTERNPPSVWHWDETWNVKYEGYTGDEATSYQILKIVNAEYGDVPVTSNPFNANDTYNHGGEYVAGSVYDYIARSGVEFDETSTGWMVSIDPEADSDGNYDTLYAAFMGTSSTDAIVQYTSHHFDTDLFYIDPEGFDQVIQGVSIAMAGFDAEDASSDYGSFYDKWRGSLDGSDSMAAMVTGVTATTQSITAQTSVVANQISTVQNSTSDLQTQFYTVFSNIQSMNQLITN